jgi:2-polyprenyl-3-methyl-5-hydroxy-6-metoxy-1,4-benzoquinol methylase
MSSPTLPDRAPDLSLSEGEVACDIYDLGPSRLVHMTGPHYGVAGLVDESLMETASSVDWLARLFALRPEWTINELIRARSGLAASVFGYYEARYGLRFARARVLDLGCGFGASAIQAFDHGASEVLGLDLEDDRLTMARQRLADLGYGDRAHFVKIGVQDELPVKDETFDVVMAMEVFEHVRPDSRRGLLRSLYGKLVAGGVLLVSTPNRLVPKDLHTTGLWFANYVPRSLVTRYARLSPRCRGQTDEELIAAGLLSFSWWEARRCLEGTDAIDLALGSPPCPDRIPSSSRAGALWNRGLYPVWRVGRLLSGRVPFEAFAGHLFLAFRRPEGDTPT